MVWMVARRPERSGGEGRREALLTFVRENPGLHGADIRRRMGLGQGSFDHNVRLLKEAGLLVTVPSGNQLLYFLPSQVKEGRVEPWVPDDLLLRFLQDRPGASGKEIAAGCGIPRSTVESHLKDLERAGKVARARQGRRYVFEAVRSEEAQRAEGNGARGFTLAPTAVLAPTATRAELPGGTAERAANGPSEPRAARPNK